jgi:uncharacterized protein YmfQ (DUF2313 family)
MTLPANPMFPDIQTPDKYTRHPGEDFAEGYQALMPKGQAWARDLRAVLRRTSDGLAWFWGYVDGRVADLLLRESDPQQTVELLPEWETAFGLPDECFPETQTIGERQKMLVQKMTWQGGQSRQYFIDVMAWLGFTIIIREWSPFMAGVSRCGDTTPPGEDTYRWHIGPPEGRFVWAVQVGYQGLVWFRAAAGQAGVDPHLKFLNPLAVECLLMRWKPAQTWIYFDFTPLDPSARDPMEGTP